MSIILVSAPSGWKPNGIGRGVGPGHEFFYPREVFFSNWRVFIFYLPTIMRNKEKKIWNKENDRVNVACWNPWGLSNEGFNYCQSINYDVLGLGELHNVHNKKMWKSKR